jgi:hypothetical protein
MTEKELREQVALGCRILGANGHGDYVWVTYRSAIRRVAAPG